MVPPFGFCGVALWRDGRAAFGTALAPGLAATHDGAAEHRLFRVASVSKIVTGRTVAAAAVAAGVGDPWAMDAQEVLGFGLRHPDFPDAPVTVGMLAAHVAGLDEAGGYAVPPDGALGGWIAATPGLWRAGTRPGTQFSYANLGYILLAGIAERWGAAPFGALAGAHLDALGLAGGFNWDGVDGPARAAALPTCRRDGAVLVPQIDGAVPPGGVALGDRVVVPRADNPAVWSPQGGLRLSLAGMLGLARSLEHGAGPRLWRRADGGGDYLDGLFQDYGAGVQFLDAPPFWPRPLIGHFGSAYGFNGGIWWDGAARVAMAYALNGVPVGDEGDDLSGAERAILDGIAALVQTHI